MCWHPLVPSRSWGGTGGVCLDAVQVVVANHQAVTYDGITDPSTYLSNWRCSIHSAFTSIPGDWTTLAIGPTHPFTAAYQTYNLPGGGTVTGLSTIIAREIAPLTTVPEPSALLLLTGGLALIPFMRRRRTRAILYRP